MDVSDFYELKGRLEDALVEVDRGLSAKLADEFDEEANYVNMEIFREDSSIGYVRLGDEIELVDFDDEDLDVGEMIREYLED